LNHNKNGTYLRGRKLREEAVEGSIEFVLLESGHNFKEMVRE